MPEAVRVLGVRMGTLFAIAKEARVLQPASTSDRDIERSVSDHMTISQESASLERAPDLAQKFFGVNR